MKKLLQCLNIPGMLFMLLACGESSNEEMSKLLQSIHLSNEVIDNNFASRARINFYDSSLKHSQNIRDSISAALVLAYAYMETGNEKKSIEILDNVLKRLPPNDDPDKRKVQKQLALAWLRAGERANCVHDNNSQSCVFPIKGSGLHKDPLGSQEAIKLYENLLIEDSTDLESRWLLNVAYMTLNGYPHDVPEKFLIKGLGADTVNSIKPFINIAAVTRLNINNQSGGSILEDFDNDGDLDIITSSWDLTENMRYNINNSDGSFGDFSYPSQLTNFTGGLNMMQTDYNNDGLKDIFIVRGAWKGKYGREPNSLLKNNGDGTFTDVTKKSGLLSFFPKQTATWADFNNDGWLDVFIGNEAANIKDYYPCELYMNNKNGTFTESASMAGAEVIAYVKGVTSGDYNNDGLTDLYMSTLQGRKILLKNTGIDDGIPKFTDATVEAGLHEHTSPSFPTWFWDYDNDGWLDIFVCSFEFKKSLAWYAAAEALGIPVQASRMALFRNKHDGTFEDVSVQTGIDKMVFAMGSNFGDIDNDGFLDMYLGTGNPVLSSLVPNKLFRNIEGKKFSDVTSSARVGSLQKGHGVSMADVDNDGDVDIHIEMGGAYAGDAYQNALYINPGQSAFNWIKIKLEGVTANRAAIGARIRLIITEKGQQRSVYRHVNSGGSFGANPLMQHIGVGSATSIDNIEILWPGDKKLQEIKNVDVNQAIQITEAKPGFERINLNVVNFLDRYKDFINCDPQPASHLMDHTMSSGIKK